MFETDAAPRADGDDRFRLAMASSGIGMAIVDLQGQWLEVNPAFERMFGWPAAEIVGRTAASITHPDDVGTSAGWLDDLKTGRRTMLDARKRYLHRDGHAIWAQANVAAMPAPDGSPAYLIVQLRDITAERATEQAQAARAASLEADVAAGSALIERMHQHEDLFAYGVSHDLRAPLRTIEGFSALLDTRHADGLDAEGREHLARIRAAAATMGSLIDALLELSRVSRAPYREAPVDMSLLAEWVGAELQDAHPGHPATITVQPGLVARGDERHLKMLLDRLMTNAWRFSQGRDRVVISVTGVRQGDVLRVTVEDLGSGFDMRYAGRLFEPFQRLHGAEDGAGHGLGLAIAQRIAERHGGRLRADSTLGEGSRFHADLPAADAE